MKLQKWARVAVQLVFWSWHAVWVLAVFCGLAPHLLPELLQASFEGEIPWGITGCALAIMVLPCFTLLAGWRLRDDHRKLFGLFYGVAGVGFTLLCLRLFLIREMTGAVAFMLVTLAAGAAFYTAALFGRLRLQSRGAAVASLVGHAALLVIGLWVGVVMGLYCVPAITLGVQAIPEILREIFEEMQSPSFWTRLPFILAMLGFMACSAFIVLLLPFALVGLYTGAWWRNLETWRRQRSLAAGLGITAATIAAWIGAFVLLNRQPQQEVLAQLEQAPADVAEQERRLADAPHIREGLLNAELAPYRYWAADGENRGLARFYREAFHTDDDVMGPQQLFDRLASPLLYDGDSLFTDRRRAEIAYERFFDRPLQQGEREAVVAAVSATYDRSEAEAGLLDVGNRTVLLLEQELVRTIDGDVAHFELHEVYENQTNEQQEVFYYFNLPERAAITGVWLADGTNPTLRFPFTVAPRGAAQAVYKAQRERRVDPALVEQVGPRQYRLRVFPIPEGRGVPESARLHMWLEWSVLADRGGWELPRLAEVRNVYWDEDDTKRTIDGAPAHHDGWLPARIDGVAEPREHAVVVDGQRVTAIPAAPNGGPVGRLAVVLDTSLSMRVHADEARAAIARLQQRGLAFDLYLAPSPWSSERPRRIDPDELDPHWYGGHTHEGVLADFADIRADERYAAVLVLTDPGSFAFLQPDARPQLPIALDGAAWPEPIWMLHFGGLPYAYDDALVELVRRTHGGVGTELDAILDRMGSPVVEGYRWEYAPATAADATLHDDAFAPIAAAALVGHLGDRGADLDAIHRIAVAHTVVTPWSSMIVLVNDEQRRALEQASKAEDRFDREAESGVESTTSPPNLEVNATPEPHEWLLIALAAVGLLLIARTRRGVQPMPA